MKPKPGREKGSFEYMKRAKRFFNQIDYLIIRLFLIALLLIAIYRVLDSEIHISRFLQP
jgi:hypothetical protein